MARCKGCGKEIVWGVTEDGKKIPLDPRAPVYAISQEGSLMDAPRPLLAKRNYLSMVSHFATCSAAARFSGSKKKGGAE